MKKYLNRDVFLILLGNMLADISVSVYTFLVLVMMFGIAEETFLLFLCAFIAMFLFVLRICILPILYSYLERKTKHDFIKIFIHKLKTSWLMKILILILAFIPTIIGMHCFYGGITLNIGLLKLSVILGLFGSYLILFLYWFIVDIIKHIKEQR